MGSSIAQFVIIWWVTFQTENAIYLSIASFVGFVPQILLSPFAGVLADRWSRRSARAPVLHQQNPIFPMIWKTLN
jgi:DHA3 family macrolide efflux protein-like MFS transporter